MTTEKTQPKARKDGLQNARELEHSIEMERHKRETLKLLVREQVIHTLGEPGDLLSVQIRPLWGTHYRVNVFVGDSIVCAKIVHSFFVLTDDDGNILESTPRIQRQYIAQPIHEPKTGCEHAGGEE